MIMRLLPLQYNGARDQLISKWEDLAGPEVDTEQQRLGPAGNVTINIACGHNILLCRLH